MGASTNPYGKVLGVPHYFVLASDGSLLHSQHLLDLRANGDYSPAKMKEFPLEWRDPHETAQSLAAPAQP